MADVKPRAFDFPFGPVPWGHYPNPTEPTKEAAEASVGAIVAEAFARAADAIGDPDQAVYARPSPPIVVPAHIAKAIADCEREECACGIARADCTYHRG